MHEYCSNNLCDISVYGGWPGPSQSIFAVGMVILALQLAVLVETRIVLLESVVPVPQLSLGYNMCCGRFSAWFAILALVVMGCVPFWLSPLHFVAAVCVFISLAWAQCT